MFVIAYDIANEKERRNIVKILEHFGNRVQYSVWLCPVDSKQIQKLCHKIQELQLQSGYVDIWQITNTHFRLGNEQLASQPVWSFIC